MARPRPRGLRVRPAPRGALRGAHGDASGRRPRSSAGATCGRSSAPQHDALHRALSHAWRPEPIARYAPTLVRPLLAARLAGLAGRPTLELFRDVASIVPIRSSRGILGLEARDETTLRETKAWLEAVLAWRHTYGEDPVVREAAVAGDARAHADAAGGGPREARRASRRHDLGWLWAVGREVAPDWDEHDVLDNARFVFEGGSETTSLLICTAAHRLLMLDGDARAAVVADADPPCRVPGGGPAPLQRRAPPGAPGRRVTSSSAASRSGPASMVLAGHRCGQPRPCPVARAGPLRSRATTPRLPPRVQRRSPPLRGRPSRPARGDRGDPRPVPGLPRPGPCARRAAARLRGVRLTRLAAAPPPPRGPIAGRRARRRAGADGLTSGRRIPHRGAPSARRSVSAGRAPT